MAQVILVTKDNQVIGTSPLLKAHQNPPQLHRAVSILIFTTDNKLLLQKRSKHKPLWPLYWSNTCCTHPQVSETNLKAASRRLKQEMGISTKLKYQYTFEYQAKYNHKLSEHEIDAVFFGFTNQKPKLNQKEAVNFKYLSIKEIVKDLKAKPDQYTPWFKLIMKKITSSDILTS